jgi:hypothetical protein
MSTNSSILRFTPLATPQDFLLRVLVVLPSFAVVYAGASYFAYRLEEVREAVRGQRVDAAKMNGAGVSRYLLIGLCDVTSKVTPT